MQARPFFPVTPPCVRVKVCFTLRVPAGSPSRAYGLRFVSPSGCPVGGGHLPREYGLRFVSPSRCLNPMAWPVSRHSAGSTLRLWLRLGFSWGIDPSGCGFAWGCPNPLTLQAVVTPGVCLGFSSLRLCFAWGFHPSGHLAIVQTTGWSDPALLYPSGCGYAWGLPGVSTPQAVHSSPVGSVWKPRLKPCLGAHTPAPWPGF